MILVLDILRSCWDVMKGALLQVEHIQDQEWLQSIRDSYQPAQIDEGLWIIPSWCQPVDSSAINIVLEPGDCLWHWRPPDHKAVPEGAA